MFAKPALPGFPLVPVSPWCFASDDPRLALAVNFGRVHDLTGDDAFCWRRESQPDLDQIRRWSNKEKRENRSVNDLVQPQNKLRQGYAERHHALAQPAIERSSSDR